MPRQSERRITARDGRAVALHRVEPDGAPRGMPVVLAAGTFSSRTFWLGSRRQGFAYRLAEAGYDAWILEPRGHGRSERPPIWTMDDWIRHDAPAAVETVTDVTGRSEVFWIGHSAGGVVGAALAGSGMDVAARVGAIVLLGSPGPSGLTGRRRFGVWATYLAAGIAPRARWSGRLLGLGSEHEPGRLVRDWMWWNLSGRWVGQSGEDYLGGLGRVRAPVLAVAGAGDRLLAPPAAVRDLLARFGSTDRELLVAGRETGYTVDFDHAGLVIGRAAREEVWPRLLEWIDRRAASREPVTPEREAG